MSSDDEIVDSVASLAMLTAALVQINTSPGGMPKLPMLAARVTVDGVESDWQTNRKYHGGPNRAVSLLGIEDYAWLASLGIELVYGSLGENFTTRGIDLLAAKPGDRFGVGKVVIEVTEPRVPCRSLDQWDARLLKLLKGRAGWMTKVIEGGTVVPGDAICLV